MIGIYKITNQINGKIYVGQSINIEKRWRQHISDTKTHKDECYIHRAMRKYGVENFSFEIIEKCSKEELNDREVYWIEYFDSTNREKGYNYGSGGNNFTASQYDYQAIYQKWLEGYKCEQLEKIFNCSGSTITRVLKRFDVEPEKIKEQGGNYSSYVAYVKEEYPLKSFKNIQEILSFFHLTDKNKNNFYNDLSYNHKFCGYYWRRQRENEIIPEITDEEFLSYQINKISYKTEYSPSSSSRCPLREELKEMIRTNSFVSIGKQYGVSDNAVRKWCDGYKLPRRKRDIKEYTDEEWKDI